MKHLLAFLLLLPPLFAFALRSGDKALELNAVWQNGPPFKVLPYTVDSKNADKLKIVVFANLLAPEFTETLPIINQAAARPNITAAVICGGVDGEIKNFLQKENGSFKLPIGVDRKSTANYMAGSLLYPKAFVIDYKGNVIWDGELMDLNDFLAAFDAKTFDADAQAKISRLLEDIQSSMRSGNDYQAERATEQILKLDPVNSPAMRMRVFMLENTNRIENAWQLIAKQNQQFPKEKKFYFLLLEFAARYPQFAENVPPLALAFAENTIPTPDELSMVAWALLTQNPFNLKALQAAGKLLDQAGKNQAASDIYHSAKALHAYRLGHVEQAFQWQKKAANNTPESKNLLEYYQALAK